MLTNEMTFQALAPQLVQSAFAEVNTSAQNASDFIVAHNATFADLINKHGKTIFSETTYTNPLEFMYSEHIPYGSYVEMVSIDINSWTDDFTNGSETHMEKAGEWDIYKANVSAQYSDLEITINAPVTIFDEAVRGAFKTPGEVENFYYRHLVAMREAIERQRFLCGKKLIDRVLTDNTNPNQRETLDITSISSKEDALAVYNIINSKILEMRVDNTKYNELGLTKQIGIRDKNGKAAMVVLIRSEVLASLQTYASDIFNLNNLLMNGIEFIPIDNFGGITSDGVTAFNEKGQQTTDLRGTNFTDPHELTKFIIMQRDAFEASTDFVSTGSHYHIMTNATTIAPKSKHHFFAPKFRCWVAVSFSADTGVIKQTATRTTKLKKED